MTVFVGGLLFMGAVQASVAHAQTTVGWAERVTIVENDAPLQAKIDTGADISSLHCACDLSAMYEAQGQRWVEFSLLDDKGVAHRLRKPVLRIASIRTHGQAPLSRMVIKLGICVDKVKKETEFTLVDRTGYKYPMLIGRNFLAGEFLVNSAETFTSKPDCR